MSDPLGFLLTWTTYGTWLRGDERWWTKLSQGEQPPDATLQAQDADRLSELPCRLSPPERLLVERTIERHCDIRGWKLWAVNRRTNHVHAVVTGNADPEIMLREFKTWCTRGLKQRHSARKNWWTERGSKRYLNDEPSLEAAILYVTDAQDRKSHDA